MATWRFDIWQLGHPSHRLLQMYIFIAQEGRFDGWPLGRLTYGNLAILHTALCKCISLLYKKGGLTDGHITDSDRPIWRIQIGQLGHPSHCPLQMYIFIVQEGWFDGWPLGGLTYGNLAILHTALCKCISLLYKKGGLTDGHLSDSDRPTWRIQIGQLGHPSHCPLQMYIFIVQEGRFDGWPLGGLHRATRPYFTPPFANVYLYCTRRAV